MPTACVPYGPAAIRYAIVQPSGAALCGSPAVRRPVSLDPEDKTQGGFYTFVGACRSWEDSTAAATPCVRQALGIFATLSIAALQARRDDRG